MLLSRAMIGMLDVFAMTAVRSSFPLSRMELMKSAISFPLSPQPTKTLSSVSAYSAKLCWNTVLPEPKPPGIAVVPPFLTCRNASITRWPVVRSSLLKTLLLNGRGSRMGHSWDINTAFPSTWHTGS